MNKGKSEDVKQTRGSDLKGKMENSQAKGEQFRAENQGADSRKTPGSSNTDKPHKK